MPDSTFRIWFEPAKHGRGQYMPDLTFHSRAAAETLVEHYNATNRPGWNGTFKVVECVNGRRMA